MREEVGQKAVDRVRKRDGVGVQHDHELRPGVGVAQGFGKRPAFEAVPARSLDDPEPRSIAPGLEQRTRLGVAGVVDDHHLEGRVVQADAGFEQAPEHALLVVARDVDRDERRPAQVQLAAVRVAVLAVVVDSGQAVAVSVAVLPAVAIAAQGPAPSGDDRDRDRQHREVVAGGVGEEERSADERQEREQPAGQVARVRPQRHGRADRLSG